MFKEFFQFKKSGYPIIPVAFYCVVIFSLISVLLIIINNYTRMDVKNYISPIEPITINIEMDKPISSNVFFCYDDNCISPDSIMLSKVYSSHFQSGYENVQNIKIKNIVLAYPENDGEFFHNIKNIDLHIGNKKYYLNKDDLAKIDKKQMKVEVSGLYDEEKNIEIYNTILLSDKGNYRGIYNNLCAIFLSLFYNWRYFIIPYLWLFFAFIFYLFNKDEIKFKPIKINIKPVYLLSVIILASVLFRINDILYYPLWTDEVYTKTVAIKDFLSCFKDPGNPPLFFIFEYIITKIFNTSDFVLRLLPMILGVLTVYAVYLLFNKISKNLALFASFMAAINTIFIYNSQEARGYSLCALLVVLSINSLFNYINNPTKKNLFIYFLLVALCVNQNYYLGIFALGNFVWGFIDLLSKKQTKPTVNFTLINFGAALTFLPYLFVSFNTALQGGFNGWIPPLSKQVFKYAINEFFINKYIFLFLCVVLLINLIFIFMPKEILSKINLKTNPKKDDILIYLVYSLAFILIVASVISVYIKPIVHKRVLLAVYAILFLIEIVNISGIIEFIKENKYTKILNVSYFIVLCAIYFMSVQPMPVIRQCRLDDFMHLLKNDVARYEKEYEIHAITCDTEEYLNHYPEIKKMNIIWHYLDANSGSVLSKLNKFDYIDKNKKSVLYFNAISVDMENILLYNPLIDIFKSNSNTSARLIYEPKN